MRNTKPATSEMNSIVAFLRLYLRKIGNIGVKL
jgi:hypothetical protein